MKQEPISYTGSARKMEKADTLFEVLASMSEKSIRLIAKKHKSSIRKYKLDTVSELAFALCEDNAKITIIVE